MIIFLLTVDALRADVLGCYNNKYLSLTPHVNEFSKSCFQFNRSYAACPYTRGSFCALLSSKYAYSREQGGGLFCHIERKIIPEYLKKIGFTSICIQTNSFLFSQMGFNKDYDLFDQERSSHKTVNYKFSEPLNIILNNYGKPAGRKKNLKSFFNFFNKKFFRDDGGLISIDKFKYFMDNFYEKGKMYFFFIHFMETHEPYIVPFFKTLVNPLTYHKIQNLTKKAHQKNVPNNQIKLIKDHYLLSANYFDQLFGNLINILKEKNIYDESLIILTSDHGEAFFEHGEWGHPPRLYEENLRIPLLIKVPGNRGQRIIDTIASHYDILPTILNILNFPEKVNLVGNNILSDEIEHLKRDVISEALEDGKIYSNSVQNENYKLIYNNIGTNEEFYEFYDLQADSGEKNNLINSEHLTYSREIERMKNIAFQHYKSIVDEKYVEDLTSVDGEVKRRLEDLGYL